MIRRQGLKKVLGVFNLLCISKLFSRLNTDGDIWISGKVSKSEFGLGLNILLIIFLILVFSSLKVIAHS